MSNSRCESPIPEAASDSASDFTSIAHQLQALERCPDLREVDEEEEKDETFMETTKKTGANSNEKNEETGKTRCRSLN